MHLPDGMIPIGESLVYWIITLICLILFFYKLSKDENNDQRIILSSILTAVTIIASSITIPSPFGVPIHLFIIPLVAIILGPLNGVFVSFLSLIVQFFLGMGGLTSIGANVLAMGIGISFVTYFIFKLLNKFNVTIGVFFATLCGICMATLIQILILVVAGVTNLNTLVYSLIPFYLFVGIIEGFINSFIIVSMENLKPEILNLKKI